MEKVSRLVARKGLRIPGQAENLASRLPYKDQEQKYEVGLLKYLNQWAKLQDFPGRMVEWDAEQVSHAYQEACRKLQALQSSGQEAYEEALSN
jgi:hypothetical protein